MSLKAFEVMKRLAHKYSTYDWIYLQELRRYNGFGHKRMRIADAVAINLYPSGGCEVNGFEVKVSRGDWLQELKDPDKADEFKQFCHRWWLVVGDKDIVKLEELPPNWGLILPRGDSLAIKKGAPKLKPLNFDMEFFTSILKRVKDEAEKTPEIINRQSDRQSELNEAYKRGYDSGAESKNRELIRLGGRVSILREVQEKFRLVVGEDINKCNIDNIANLIKFGRSINQDFNYQHRFESFCTLLTNLLKNVEGCAEELEYFQEEFQNADS